MSYKAFIDSINFSDKNLSKILSQDESFVIEEVKTLSVFEPNRWKETFGTSLTKGIVETNILHTTTGLTLPLKRYAANKEIENIDFAGLKSYNEKSIYLNNLLHELKTKLMPLRVTRIDVCIDFNPNVPKRIIRALIKARTPFTYKNTNYFKTSNEKKKNNRLNIKVYSKSKKEKLNYELERLEFVFHNSYINNVAYHDIENVFLKMKKTIKRFASIDVKITPIS